MYKRILLKLSGEALGKKDSSFDFDILENTARTLRDVRELGVEVGVVIGGGNIWRGRSGGTMDRNRADQMGMLATVINSIAMQDALIALGVPASVLTSVPMETFADYFTSREATRRLSNKEIVLFAGGTGHPFFTTDTGASLRACEIGADALLLAKNIDAVYDKDPNVHADAVRYEHLTYQQVIEQNLKATDLTAITMCKEQSIPIVAFGLDERDSIMRAVRGERIGTLIDGNEGGVR